MTPERTTCTSCKESKMCLPNSHGAMLCLGCTHEQWRDGVGAGTGTEPKPAPPPEPSESEISEALVKERAFLVTLAERCRVDGETLTERRVGCLERISEIDRELSR